MAENTAPKPKPWGDANGGDNGTSRAGDTPSPPSPLLDHMAFPLLVDMIFDYATYDEWVLIRQTSREYRTRMEALICRHVLVQDQYIQRPSGIPTLHVFTTPKLLATDRKIIPCLFLQDPFRERTLMLLAQHTRILDDDTFDVDNDGNPATVGPDSFPNLQVIRGHPYGCVKAKVAKTIQWHTFPFLMDPGEEWEDRLAYGAGGFKHATHQVHHYTYTSLSVLFPPFCNVEWAAAETMVFIFEAEEPEDDVAELLYDVMDQGGEPCGRSSINRECLSILRVLGIGRNTTDGLLSESVKITFVGLDEFFVFREFKRSKNEKRDRNERIRDFIQTEAQVFASHLPKFSALLTHLLDQSEFITKDEYILRVGKEQFEFETTPNM